MVKRVFDRRGRQNWNAEKHETEDRRLRERRAKSDRRVDQRRQGSPWPEELDQTELRISERRVLNRRDVVNNETEIKRETRQTADEPEPGQPSRGSRVSIGYDATLIEAISMMSSQNARWLVIFRDGQEAIGILSEHDVIGAIAEHGDIALSEPVSRFLTPLVH